MGRGTERIASNRALLSVERLDSNSFKAVDRAMVPVALWQVYQVSKRPTFLPTMTCPAVVHIRAILKMSNTDIECDSSI
jgi:hypothetical protein